MRFSNFFFPFWGSFSWTETAAAFGSRKFGRPLSRTEKNVPKEKADTPKTFQKKF